MVRRHFDETAILETKCYCYVRSNIEEYVASLVKMFNISGFSWYTKYKIKRSSSITSSLGNTVNGSDREKFSSFSPMLSVHFHLTEAAARVRSRITPVILTEILQLFSLHEASD